MTDFTKHIDLASERLGAAVLLASDDFFAQKENLVLAAEPVWKEHAYTANGKWMDGWESRRKRTPGHDWAIIRLGVPGVLRGVIVDTAFFTGNYPDACAIDAAYVTGNLSPEEIESGSEWTEVLPQSKLEGSAKNPFAIESPIIATHLRLRIFPDGGVARLRVYGDPIPNPARLSTTAEVNLLSMALGARAVGCSDDHYGKPNNLLQPGRAPNMGDGWETKRRRGPGHDWATIQLALPGTVSRLVIDTDHNKGNYPDTADVEATSAPAGSDLDAAEWFTLLPRQKLQAHMAHRYSEELAEHEPITHLRLRIFPDGGVSRLRVFGTPSAAGLVQARLAWINALPAPDAQTTLETCCASSTWAAAMTSARPFTSVAQAVSLGESASATLSSDDWLEAFAGHPRIGGKHAEKQTGETASKWSSGEQAGMSDASETTKDRLARLNDEYFEKHGFIFIICATGKSADEMSAALADRLSNDTATEIRNAATEQRKITTIRLNKYFGAAQ